MSVAPLSLVIAAIVAWLAIGAAGLVRPRNLRFVSRALFPAGGLVGFALAAVAGYSIDFRSGRKSRP